MGSEWRTFKVSEFADVIGGGTPKTKVAEYWNGSIPWLTPKDISNHSGRYISKGERNISEIGLRNSSARILPPKTVLLTSRAPVGYLAISENELTTNQGFRSLIPKDGFCPEFIYYLLFQNVEYLKRHASGSTFQELSGGTLKDLEFKIPEIAEQRAIAHILGTLDDKIELNRRMNKVLEATARAIFKSWFVDFDPVRARRGESRFALNLPPEILDLFPDSFEESELGEIPKGWGISDLGALSHILNGFAFKSKDYCGPEGIRVLRTKNFTQSGYASKNTDDVFLPKSFLSSHKQYICEPFDFHLVMVGASVGNTALILPNMLPALRNQNMWCFRPKKTMPSKFYLNYAVQRKVESVMSWADGSARSFFRKSDFRKHMIIVPTEDLLKLFEGKIKGYFELIATNTVENETLASLRDTLLPKLISGELRVPDAEKFVEEVGV